MSDINDKLEEWKNAFLNGCGVPADMIESTSNIDNISDRWITILIVDDKTGRIKDSWEQEVSECNFSPDIMDKLKATPNHSRNIFLVKTDYNDHITNASILYNVYQASFSNGDDGITSDNNSIEGGNE